jgi:hypothetical protein
MEFQRKVRQPFLKLTLESLSVFASLKADHQIVSVTDNHHLSKAVTDRTYPMNLCL